MTVSLLLYERLAQDTNRFVKSYTHHARDWGRSIRAVGGYWMGDFTVGPETMSRAKMIEAFNLDLGRRLVENTSGVESWEGEIIEIELMLRGILYRRTLDPERWHNKVKVRYTDESTGNSTATAWGEETDSSDVYGESCYIDLIGETSAAAATALRDRRLAEFAFPKSVPAGSLSFGQESFQEDALRVRCAGYAYSMNRRFQESDIASAAISTQLAALAGNSEFVTAGDIDTNSLSAPVKASDIPQRLWDAAEELILMGDASGNRWVGGVYKGRKFNYCPAQTSVTHYWRNGRLTDLIGRPVIPSLIWPNIIVQISDTPLGVTPPGGAAWDSPRNLWIEEVEFIAPDGYRLMPYGGGGELIGGEI